MNSPQRTAIPRFTQVRTLLLAGTLAVAAAACTDDPTRVAPDPLVSPAAALAELPVSECDNMPSEWLWCDDFEEDRLDSYFGYNDASGRFTRAAGVGVSGGYGMRARWQQGQVSVGTLQLGIGRNPVTSKVQGDPDAKHQEVYWRMYVRTQPGWTGGSGWKLSRATVMAGRNWEQAMIAHVWGDNGPEEVIDPASGTDLQGNLITTRYNDFANLRWLGSRRGSTPVFESARAGQWQCVEARARLNRAGRSDGVFQMWINGRLEASRTDLNWLGSYDDYGINAVFFENYWNDGSPAAQERYIDNLVVSTEPIGCLSDTPVDPGVDDPEDPEVDDPTEDGPSVPAGLERITDRAFTALDDDGWRYNSSPHFSIVQDATAPRSPGTVGQARYSAGFGGGSGPISTWSSFGNERYTELRVTQWVKVSDNFHGHPSGVNKVLHIWMGGRNIVYTSMQGGGNGALRPQVRLQGANEPSDAERVNLRQNIDTGDSFSFRRGTWHKWETYLRSNTRGRNNGVVKIRVDGRLLAEYTDVNFAADGSSNHWEHVYWNPTWGGIGDTVPETMYMWTDHLQALGGHGSGGDGTLPDDGSDDGGSGDDGPSDDAPGGNDPGDSEPGGEDPEDEEPGDDVPGDDGPSEEEPGDDGPSDDAPGGDDPGESDPGGEDPDDKDPGGDDDGSAGDDEGEGDDPPADDDKKEKKPKKDGRGRGSFPGGLPPGFPSGMTFMELDRG